MLDIKIFREEPDTVYESEKKRFRDTINVDKVIEYDNLWREGLKQLNDLRSKKNKLSKSFKQAKKDGNIQEVVTKSKEVAAQIKELEPKIEEYEKTRDEYRYKVGNIIDEEVPVSDTEDDNKIIKTYGDLPEFTFEPLNHVDLIESVDGADTQTASEVSGSRFYYLKEDILFLNLALIQFALNELTQKGYTPLQTPFFVKSEVAEETSELAEFEETLYKVENEDLYLIATAEQTLAALHRNEIIDDENLPKRYCALSTCFRKEAGSHGKDTLGIFRVHQFEKIEQFIYSTPEDSTAEHKRLLETTESIYQKLGLPYQVVAIVSSALNDNASIKYDLEAYFPGSQTYRELVSCTNCKDYQARKTNTRHGRAGSGDAQTLHTLNSTAIATERTICCILENYQQEDGSVRVPDVLLPYMNGKTVIKRHDN
ncbi:MAG: serine--tRNA ligase [Methanosphaera sp.]|nr:serine--tRNA ligase [Methanosphaera sp.]